MKTSVVICAYTIKRWDDLTAAVRAVQDQSLPPDEILVVIDHNPALLERTQSAFPAVRALANQDRRGLSGARNTGVRAATGEIIAFLDEDAQPARDWLERLVRAYESPQVMGVGGAIVPRWLGEKPGWFPDEFLWVVGCTYQGMPKQAAPVRNLIGANMSFRRQVFSQVGGFTQAIGRIGTYPAGCEETELSIRLRQALPGSVLLYQPEATVQHNVPQERSHARYFLRRCYAEGLSKAQVARLVGARDGLGSERDYTLRTLPKGALRSVRSTLHGDRNGFARMVAIIAGLAATTAGYLAGRLKLSLSLPVLPASGDPIEQ